MPTEPEEIATTPRRQRRAIRVVLGISMIGGPVAVVVALGMFWVRSLHVEETLSFGRRAARFDRAAGTASTGAISVKAQSALGVLGVTLGRDRWSQKGLTAAYVDAIRQNLGSGAPAWTFKRESTTGSDRVFDRDREDVGPLRTLHWGDWRREQEAYMIGGLQLDERWELVAPYWFWMLPAAIPPIWWRWCPAGRPFPRLSMRRLAFATAALGLVLATLAAAFGRASIEDRALAVISEFGGRWEYDRDPADPAHPYIAEVDLAVYLVSRDFDDAEAPRLRAALAEFPRLRSLKIGSKNVTGAGLALLADHPDLDFLWLAGTRADDPAMAHLRGHRKLREINLNATNVTDAGLADLGTLPALETLWLDDLKITDAGLLRLSRLPRLKALFLQDAGIRKDPRPIWLAANPADNTITAAGIKKLFEAIPTLDRVTPPDGFHLTRARPSTGSDGSK